MARAGLARAARMFAALACLGYAGLALGSGLDRLSAARPELAPSVPAAFASQALRSEGAALIAKAQPRAALKRGEAAVIDAPLDPASTALLGMARFRLGDIGGADRAFRIAGQLGWRDRFTQLYWMGRALEIGDWRVAAMRLDALLRQNPALLGERQLMDPLERSPAGRAALAERMLANPGWLQPYTAAVSETPRDVLLQRTQVLGSLAALKGVLGCEPVAPLIERLVANSAEQDAAVLWRQHCPGAGQSLVYDGRFVTAALDQDRSQFAWTFIGQSDASLMFEAPASDGSRLLAIDSSASYPRQIARQLVLVPPGAYRLSWSARTADGQPSNVVLAALTCAQVPDEWLPAELDPAGRRWVARVTIGTDCTAQWLSLGLAASGGAATLGDIRLDPAK